MVFNFTVCRCANEGQPASGAQAEAAEAGSLGSTGRHCERQIVRPGNHRAVYKDLFALVGPIAIAIEIEPCIQQTTVRTGGCGDENLHACGLPRCDVARERDAFLIVVGTGWVGVVTFGAGLGLAVHFAINNAP